MRQTKLISLPCVHSPRTEISCTAAYAVRRKAPACGDREGANLQSCLVDIHSPTSGFPRFHLRRRQTRFQLISGTRDAEARARFGCSITHLSRSRGRASAGPPPWRCPLADSPGRTWLLLWLSFLDRPVYIVNKYRCRSGSRFNGWLSGPRRWLVEVMIDATRRRAKEEGNRSWPGDFRRIGSNADAGIRFACTSFVSRASLVLMCNRSDNDSRKGVGKEGMDGRDLVL